MCTQPAECIVDVDLSNHQSRIEGYTVSCIVTHLLFTPPQTESIYTLSAITVVQRQNTLPLSLIVWISRTKMNICSIINSVSVSAIITPPSDWFTRLGSIVTKFYWKNQNLISNYWTSNAKQLWLAIEANLIWELDINSGDKISPIKLKATWWSLRLTAINLMRILIRISGPAHQDSLRWVFAGLWAEFNHFFFLNLSVYYSIQMWCYKLYFPDIIKYSTVYSLIMIVFCPHGVRSLCISLYMVNDRRVVGTNMMIRSLPWTWWTAMWPMRWWWTLVWFRPFLQEPTSSCATQ